MRPLVPLILLLAALIGSDPARSNPAEAPMALANPFARDGQDLSGAWRYIVDPMGMGFRPGRMRNFAQDRVAQNQELLEYHWDSSPALTVPGDWTSQVPELLWYEGLVWHQRRFDASVQAGRRAFLHFEAVNYRAHVYLNGEKVGEHVGGFTPFSIEVTGKLRPTGNVLVVGVDSRHDAASVPAPQVDWWNYGGITRPVRLIQTPETFARSYRVAMRRDGMIETRVRLDGPQAAGKAVSVSVPELGLALRGTTGPDGLMQASARPRGLVRWSPERPRLYEVIVRTGDAEIRERIGFRTIEVQGPRVLLNGRPVFLRGVSIHEEAIGPVASRAITPAAARALLSEAKALGANFVRLAHYPHSAEMTRLADEMGLLVWSEIPVYWSLAFDNPETLATARRMLAEMIDRDINRASIVIWSVGNETPETPARLAFLKQLIDDVRTADSTRLVSAALHDDADSSSGPEGRVQVDDEIGRHVDVLAMNRYEAWYGYRNPRQIDEVNWSVAYDKPLIFSEFGADALFGYRADPLERWSEDYQRLLYERTFAMAERIPNLVGTSPWILKDFRSPRRFHGTYQQYWNRKGLIDPAGNRKLAWETVRAWYARKAADLSGDRAAEPQPRRR